MGAFRIERPNPLQVPTQPVEVDWSHPLASGLWGAYIPGGVQPLTNLASGTPLILSTAGSIVQTSRGPASTSQFEDFYNPPAIFGDGAAGFEASIFWLGSLINSTNAVTFSQGLYSNPNATPYATYGIGANATTPTVLGQWNAQGNYNNPSTSGALALGDQSVGATFVANATTTYNNGAAALGGLPGGFGSVNYTATSYFAIGSGNASGATSLVLNYLRPLTAQDHEWLNAEPFAMLRLVRRRTYFVPASSGASLSAAGRVAPFSGAIGLRFGASASIQAASKKVDGALALSPGVQSSIAGAAQKSSAAIALSPTVQATVSGIQREISAAISLDAVNGAAVSIAGIVHPFGAAVSQSVSASASVEARAKAPSSDISALLSAAMAIAAEVYGPTANVRVNAAVTGTVAIAALLAPASGVIAITPSVPSSRLIRPQPVVRDASALGAAPVAFWSQRAAGDVDTFSVDFSPLLAAGEALTGAPVVTVPTGDLTVADVSESGSVVSLTVSGTGTQGNYSSILIEAATTSERMIALTGMVVTGAFLPSLPNPDMGAMLRVSPVFGPRAAGDADIYAVDFSPWLDVGETITGCTVSALTADLAVSQASYAGSIVTWQASGSGAPGAWTAFLAVIKTSVGRSLGLYCGVRTARG
jgi:hypothetical protein